MGAWAANTFGNDTACDWAYGLEKMDDLSLVRKTLQAVLDVGDEDLDADLGCEGLAACEVIARLKGKWGLRNAYSESVDNWVESHKTIPIENLDQTALKVIGRILTPPSELLDLWSEGDATEWKADVEELRIRVQG